MRKVVGYLLVTALGFALAGFVTAASAVDPKYTIGEVMKEHGKMGIVAKLRANKATKEDKEKLVEMYIALGENDPPKGDKESWKQKCDALVAAAKAVAKGEAKAMDKLNKAINCKACHDVHKGE